MAFKSEFEVTMSREEYEESLETVKAEVAKLQAENKMLRDALISRIEAAREFANSVDRLFIEQEDFRKGEKE